MEKETRIKTIIDKDTNLPYVCLSDLIQNTIEIRESAKFAEQCMEFKRCVLFTQEFLIDLQRKIDKK